VVVPVFTVPFALVLIVVFCTYVALFIAEGRITPTVERTTAVA
jgi:hypothetical protein